MSMGLIGTVAFPAFAAAQPDEAVASVAPAAQTQQFRTDNIEAVPLVVDVPGVEEDAALVKREKDAEEAKAEAAKAEAEAAEAESLAAARNVDPTGAVTSESVIYNDVPSGAGAQGILAAAISQLGDQQDCTALVERSLRAIGHNVGDLGTAIWQYDPYGTRVSTDALAPGDILIYGNARSGAHVAIYEGNGMAIHGGFPGGTVRAGVHAAWEPLTGAIRPF
ncbi:C40 family peptidase [Leucobacter sp. UCMA 4100]|nr:C40 family peptidase [Leucobacter sp. UCMA 4100]